MNLLKQQTGRIREITIAMSDFLDKEKKTHMAESKRVFSSSETILSIFQFSIKPKRKTGRDFPGNQRVAQLPDLLLRPLRRPPRFLYFVSDQVINFC